MQGDKNDTMPPVKATAKFTLITLFILALFIRIYKLDTFPLGFHVDEAKVAWEALSILKTGKDDHGNTLALYYNSFGDYRPTGIFYTAIPFIMLFGRTNFAVRFSSALFGALTVFPLFSISFLITKNKKISLISSTIFTIIPWDITTSRATSEVVISCFLILTSLSLLKKRPIFSFIFLITSFFFYHSARVMGPIIMLTWIIYLTKYGKLRLSKKIILSFLITSLFSFILLLSPSGRARYDQVKLAAPTLRNITIQYTSYFNPNFLIGDIAKPFRYRAANTGIISIPIFLCFILGIFVITKTGKNKILLLFYALGPIPAALTLEDSPNLHRAFFMLPFLVIVSAIGINWLWEKYRFLSKVTIVCIIWSFLTFTINYLSVNNNLAYEYRDPEAKELSLYIASIQNNYTKIYVTNGPDSPYPWYGFFNDVNPSLFNAAQDKNIGSKWEFKNIVWDDSKCPAANAFDIAKRGIAKTKIMVVDNGDCFTDFGKDHPEAKIIKEFRYNGKVNYRIWEYQPTK